MKMKIILKLKPRFFNQTWSLKHIGQISCYLKERLYERKNDCKNFISK